MCPGPGLENLLKSDVIVVITCYLPSKISIHRKHTFFSLFSIPAAAAGAVSAKTKDDYSRAYCALALGRTHTSSGNRDKEGRFGKNNQNYFNEIVLKMP